MNRLDLDPATYWAAQEQDIGWSHQHQVPMDRIHARQFYTYLSQTGRLDYPGTPTFCDFGGNDGTAAEELRRLSHGTSYCYDLAKDRQDYGRKAYPGVKFINGPLESIDIPYKSVDWGFSVQTLEHTRDIPKVMKELSQVLLRGIYLSVPVEDCMSFAINGAHMAHTTDPFQWIRWATEGTDFRLADWAKAFNTVYEGQSKMGADGFWTSGPDLIYVFTLPGDIHYNNRHMTHWYETMDTTHVGHCG